jgi:hypothetical protein
MACCTIWSSGLSMIRSRIGPRNHVRNYELMCRLLLRDMKRSEGRSDGGEQSGLGVWISNISFPPNFIFLVDTRTLSLQYTLMTLIYTFFFFTP